MNTQLALLAKVPEFDTPFESQGKALKLRDMMHQGEVQNMDMQTRRRAIADEDTLREIYKASGGDHEAVVKGLYNRGMGGKAQALEKARVDMDKDRATAEKTRYEAAEKRINMAGSAAKSVIDNPTPETAIAVAQYLESQGVVPAGTAAATAEKIKANPSPEFIRSQAEIAFRTALDAKEQLPKYFNQNRGGTAAVVGIDAVTGASRDAQSAPITQSADNAATQAQSDANNRRAVAASLANAAAVRDTAAATRDAARITADSKRMQDTEMKLADDYRTESKGWAETATAIKMVNAALKTADKNPGSALAAGTKFMKILDPTSVVRESELGMALNASGWFDRATNIAQQLQSGKIMTAEQVKNLTTAANTLFREAKSAQLEIDKAYETRAKAYGVNPRNIITDRGQNAPDEPDAPAANPEIDALLKKYGSKK